MTRRNSRRSAQEALFAPSHTTTPPDEEKAVERTEKQTQKTVFVQDRLIPEEELPPIAPAKSPADIISDEYDIAPNCTNVPRLLYAILCEVVRGRV